MKEIKACSEWIKARDAFEHSFFLKLIKRFSGNVTQAAKASGINRTDFYRHLKKFNIELPPKPLVVAQFKSHNPMRHQPHHTRRDALTAKAIAEELK